MGGELKAVSLTWYFITFTVRKFSVNYTEVRQVRGLQLRRCRMAKTKTNQLSARYPWSNAYDRLPGFITVEGCSVTAVENTCQEPGRCNE